MNPEQKASEFGPEYPAFLLHGATRIPLHREKRFSRVYINENAHHHISRFMDGSVTITFDQLKTDWPTWDKSLRSEFANNFRCLKGNSESDEILRFVTLNGNFDHLSAIALSIAYALPQEEAFAILSDCLTKMPLAKSANISQAIAQTKHPNATETLQRHLDRLWSAPDLWDDAKFMNWTAYSTVCNIRHLLELSVSPSKFEDKVRQLSTHACSGLRDSCGRFLTKYYPWLKHPGPF